MPGVLPRPHPAGRTQRRGPPIRTDMAAVAIAARALLLLAAVGPAAALWPQPQLQRSPPAPARCPLPPSRFHFAHAAGSAVGPGCAVLDEAFQRYRALIFSAARPAGEGRWGCAPGEGSVPKAEPLSRCFRRGRAFVQEEFCLLTMGPLDSTLQ